MIVDTAFLITAFVTLFVIIDPIGMTPLFVAMTQGMSTAKRRAIALRACITSALILIIFASFGEAVLGFIGISMPAFRIAGGILLFLTALDMLFERRSKRRKSQADEAEEEDDSDDPSIFPLAIPLIGGPGSITTVILLAGQKPGLEGLAWVIGVMLCVVSMVFVLFLTAGMLERAMGRTGINVVTRLLGMLLAALAVQFVLDGLRGFGLAA
jgi:multiple antibiotic resistance protein